MHTFESSDEFLAEIAKSADLCMKPWIHSVIQQDDVSSKNFIDREFSELMLLILCRDSNGIRFKDHDLELEIFRSGLELNITLAWNSFPLRPILWQGKHSLWMDASTGKRSTCPEDGEKIESLARRLRATVSSLIID